MKGSLNSISFLDLLRRKSGPLFKDCFILFFITIVFQKQVLLMTQTDIYCRNSEKVEKVWESLKLGVFCLEIIKPQV